MEQDERSAGDRPGALSRLIGQYDIISGGILPIRIYRGGLKRVRRGGDILAGTILQKRIGQLVLQRVGIFDIPYRTLYALHIVGDAFIAFSACAGRPGHGLAGPYFLAPLIRDFCKVVGEYPSCARSVGPVDNGYRRVGKIESGIAFLEGRGIPSGYSAEEYSRQCFRRQPKLS